VGGSGNPPGNNGDGGMGGVATGKGTQQNGARGKAGQPCP
jgi:hypothetical protein